MTNYRGFSMIMVNVHRLKANPKRCIDLAITGERVVLCKRNKAIAEITPLKKTKGKFKLGWAMGKGHLGSDFFEPMTTEELGIL